MKKFIAFGLVCMLSGFVVIACQRDRGVYAGNESDYQPRAATTERDNASRDVKGELMRVDIAGKTVAVRVANGMEQTLNFDNNTVLTGLALPQAPASPPAKTRASNNTPLRNLAGKEGSELTVQWRDESGAKMATNIEVTQVSISKNARRSGKRRY